MTDTNFDLYAEDWAPSYGPPASFQMDGTDAVEPAESATFRAVAPTGSKPTALAFVEATRRVEIGLWQIGRVTGETVRGIAGAYADALNKLLADGKFIGHLVREREVALLTEASRVLRSLSGDRFGFSDGFKVIDRYSGQERGPDALSGGERFQASLALALALVEIATRSGGQLEAVFVDEGFGSLDAGSLDQALTTLGAVASDGKLVALVSHLRQVAEHVDQVILVERDDATGSRVRPLDQTERELVARRGRPLTDDRMTTIDAGPQRSRR